MSKPLSVLTSIEKGKISSSEPFLVCLDIEVIEPSTLEIIETMHLIRNTEDITYRGTIYTAAAFDISFKAEAGTLPQVSLIIKDYSRAVQGRMQAYGGGMGFKVVMTVISTADLTQPPEIVEYFEVIGASAGDYIATFVLGAENVLASPFPRRKQTKRFCQFRYKGSSCGYRDLQHLVSPGTAGNYAWAPDSALVNPAQNWIGYSEDLSLWTALSGVGVASNTYADPLGAMTMDTLTDDSAALFEGVQYAVTVPNDSATYKVAFLVRKDLTASHRAGANFTLQGGTVVSANLRYALDGTNPSTCTIVSYDANNWLVTGSITNNTTGNVTLVVQLYAATAATKGGGDNAVAVGSTTYGWVRLQRSNVLLPYLKTTTGVSNKGDIDLLVKVAMDDWTPTTTGVLFSKLSAAGQYSWDFYINPAGTLGFLTSSDGTAYTAISSTVAPGFANGSVNWIRVTRVGLTGVIKFYTSTNGITWVQLGTDVANTAGSVFTSTSQVRVGMDTGSPTAGKIYYAEFRNSIDGAVVSNFDARDFTVGALTGVSLVTGDLWTVAQSGLPAAAIVYDTGYPKANCDLTLQGDFGCAYHENTLNFGGFPGLNNSNNKYA